MNSSRIYPRFLYVKLFIPFAILLAFATCKKINKTETPPPNIILPADSLYKIANIQKINLNECRLSLYISPPANEPFIDGKLLWSRFNDFHLYDSLNLFSSSLSPYINDKTIGSLADSTNYYFRITVRYKNISLYSDIKSITTDKLRITDYPSIISKGSNIGVKTNYTNCLSDTSGKIFLNNIQCVYAFSNCELLTADIPTIMPPGKYKLHIKLKGMESEIPDSVEVLKGEWQMISSPVFPNGVYNNTENALGDYTVCNSPTRSYIFGGLLHYPVNDIFYPFNPDYVYQRMKFLLEFDPVNKTWTKRLMTNPKYFADIAAQYYNNTIYILSGIEETASNGYEGHVTQMLRLDLNTMTWNTADTIPFGPVSWPVSTEVNNEFYVGLGEKFISILSQNPPFTQLWKYNPQQNIWTRLADFPGGYQRYPTMIALNNKIYVFSGAIPVGSSSTNFTREFWQYDPSLNVWSQLQLPPESIIPAGEKCSMAQVNGKLYFFTSQKYTFWGAYYGMDIKRICLEYDPVSTTWKKFSIPRQVDLLKVISQNNNTVYLHSNKVGYTESIINLTYEFINQ